ncbi:hypothetical protein ACVRWQ_02955 [Streptococcus phocae subsp. salmonis]|uniref:hypothetical protein n=1 Tax=Streptococcus phocae TaxID=119224 RepID=UPI00053215E7|nr:hypothetical protein [Streptococcus phocae]KGR72290.1 hypothetical protein NX86_07240 [Streptococcus phocae subsp. salmonis]
MKKKLIISLIALTGILVIFLVGNQFIKTGNPKPTVDLTVYTISSEDTEKWNKVKQLEMQDGIYLITVKEVASSEEIFSNIIADGAAMGFGISEEEVKQFNNNLGNTIEDSKHNQLIGIEFFTFSNEDKGFVVANFDYGKKELNDQKKEKEELYKKLYEAFKE